VYKRQDYNPYAQKMSNYQDSYNPVQFMTMPSRIDDVKDVEDDGGEIF
jgi:hypothetical protein